MDWSMHVLVAGQGTATDNAYMIQAFMLFFPTGNCQRICYISLIGALHGGYDLPQHAVCRRIFRQTHIACSRHGTNTRPIHHNRRGHFGMASPLPSRLYRRFDYPGSILVHHPMTSYQVRKNLRPWRRFMQSCVRIERCIDIGRRCHASSVYMIQISHAVSLNGSSVADSLHRYPTPPHMSSRFTSSATLDHRPPYPVMLRRSSVPASAAFRYHACCVPSPPPISSPHTATRTCRRS